MNKSKQKILFVACVITVLIVISTFWHAQKGIGYSKLTVRVVDEQYKPVKNARVGITYYLPKSSNPWDGAKSLGKNKQTDENGYSSFIVKTISYLRIAAGMEGYYSSRTGRYKLEKMNGVYWQPWNPTVELILRKKLKPIPLYAKRFFYLKLPLATQRMGFDIWKGDWVEPYGKGLFSDVYIEYNREHKDFSNFRWILNITMSSTNDGFYAITEKKMYTNSTFAIPYLAPANEYTSTNILYIVDVKNGIRTTNTILPADNYFFRFRTKIDDNGNVKECYYGKVLDLDNQPALDSANLSFSMYFNPIQNDRNLEFDGENSLFKDLKRKEHVKKP